MHSFNIFSVKERPHLIVFYVLSLPLLFQDREDSRSESYIQASHLYYAYHMVHEYCDNTFTLTEPEVLLRASFFLLNSLADIPAPAGISRAKILYSLLQQGLVLQLYDVARYAYSQLQTIKYSQIWDNSIELSYMMLQVYLRLFAFSLEFAT